VNPGDEVVVRGRLRADAKLGRLFLFARQGDDEFAPYVQNVGALAAKGFPDLLTPLSLRLVRANPERQISFVSDIDGHIRVMQEVDTPKDPLVKLTVRRKINPALPWTQRLTKRITGMFT
jgi:hypothetical protein